VTETLIPVRSPEFLRSSQPLQSARDLLGVTLLHDDSPDNDPSCPNWEMWLRAAGVNDIDAARCPRFNQPSLVIVSTILGHSIALAKSDLAAEDIIEIYR
jgi:LysR family glycine cleavage system transcriptional activator